MAVQQAKKLADVYERLNHYACLDGSSTAQQKSMVPEECAVQGFRRWCLPAFATVSFLVGG
jgi:hypothetical protein